MLDLGESTASLAYLLDPALMFPPAIVYADDGNAPARSGKWIAVRTSNTSQLLADRFSAHHVSLRAAPVSTADRQKPVEVKPQDTWLWNAISAITAHRDADWLEDGIEPPSQEALDIAEVLAAGFSHLPINRRPQFGVDADGRASYSTYENGFYLHLTIGQDGLVSWYSVEHDVETFRDDVEVNPIDVRSLAEEIMSA